MIEQQVATPETQQEERLGERRQALRGLAADMLLIWGMAEDRWRSITWQDEENGRSYCLNTGDFTQLQAGEGHRNDMWLYVMDGDEHDAFCLESGHEFAAPDSVFEDIAEAINTFASQRTYDLACEILKTAPALQEYSQSEIREQRKQVRIQFERHAVRLQDFTDAEHGPFIWVRTTDAFGAGHEVLSCYDLARGTLRPADPHNPYGPIDAGAPPEDHVRWLMRMLTHGSVAPQPRGRFMFAAPRATESSALAEAAADRIVAKERQFNGAAEQRQMSPSRIEIASVAADILSNLEASYGLYANTELDGSTVLRTIVDLIDYDYSTQSGRKVETAVGFHVTNEGILLETFSIEAGVNSRRDVYIDLSTSEAAGSVMLQGSNGEGLRGDAAVDEMQEIMDTVVNADISLALRPCPLDIAAGFDSNEIRDSGR